MVKIHSDHDYYDLFLLSKDNSFLEPKSRCIISLVTTLIELEQISDILEKNPFESKPD